MVHGVKPCYRLLLTCCIYSVSDRFLKFYSIIYANPFNLLKAKPKKINVFVNELLFFKHRLSLSIVAVASAIY